MIAVHATDLALAGVQCLLLMSWMQKQASGSLAEPHVDSSISLDMAMCMSMQR